jgi:hypothetical protein
MHIPENTSSATNRSTPIIPTVVTPTTRPIRASTLKRPIEEVINGYKNVIGNGINRSLAAFYLRMCGHTYIVLRCMVLEIGYGSLYISQMNEFRSYDGPGLSSPISASFCKSSIKLSHTMPHTIFDRSHAFIAISLTH